MCAVSNVCYLFVCLFVCSLVCLYFKRMLNNQNKMLPTAVSAWNIKYENRLLLLLLPPPPLVVVGIFDFRVCVIVCINTLFSFMLLLEKFHIIPAPLPSWYASLNIFIPWKKVKSFKEFSRFILTIRLNDEDADNTSNPICVGVGFECYLNRSSINRHPHFKICTSFAYKKVTFCYHMLIACQVW